MRAGFRHLDHRLWSLNVGGFAVFVALCSTEQCQAAPAAFATDVNNDNPYAYYRFNETSGTTATDSSVNARNATYNFSITGASSTAGAGAGSDNAVILNGTNQALSISQPNITAFAASLATSSYEFVFKTNASFSKATQTPLFSVSNTGTSSADKSAVSLTLNSGLSNGSPVVDANNADFFIRNAAGSNSRFLIPQSSFTDGNYHDLLLVYSGDQNTKFSAYVDGSLVASSTTSSVTSNAGGTYTAAFVVGAGSSNGNPFAPFANVTFDEAALYSSELSSTDASLHAMDAGVPEPASAALGCVSAAAMTLRRRRRPARYRDPAIMAQS